MRTLSVLVSVLIASTALAGCSSTPSGDGRECVTVPDSIMSRIADGANDTPIKPVAAAGVESKVFAEATIVAMEFEAADGEPATGAWAILGSVDEPSGVLAVDGFANNFTDWPNEVNGETLNGAEDGVTEAKACLAAL